MSRPDIRSVERLLWRMVAQIVGRAKRTGQDQRFDPPVVPRTEGLQPVAS
jgi:hypothetical protein